MFVCYFALNNASTALLHTFQRIPEQSQHRTMPRCRNQQIDWSVTRVHKANLPIRALSSSHGCVLCAKSQYRMMPECHCQQVWWPTTQVHEAILPIYHGTNESYVCICKKRRCIWVRKLQRYSETNDICCGRRGRGHWQGAQRLPQEASALGNSHFRNGPGEKFASRDVTSVHTNKMRLALVREVVCSRSKGHTLQHPGMHLQQWMVVITFHTTVPCEPRARVPRTLPSKPSK